MLNEKIAKQEQERSRLLRSWNNERLLSKASNAYEAIRPMVHYNKGFFQEQEV